MKPAIVLALALAPGLAAAQAPERTRSDERPVVGQRFDSLDRNRDGFLSRDEGARAEELNSRFSELDANNDSKLSREEYRVLERGRAASLPGAAAAGAGTPPP